MGPCTAVLSARRVIVVKSQFLFLTLEQVIQKSRACSAALPQASIFPKSTSDGLHLDMLSSYKGKQTAQGKIQEKVESFRTNLFASPSKRNASEEISLVRSTQHPNYVRKSAECYLKSHVMTVIIFNLKLVQPNETTVHKLI